MCFAAKQSPKQPKFDARYYEPPTNDIRSQEFIIAQRKVLDAVERWRKQRRFQRAFEQHKAAFKAKLINLLETSFSNMDVPADFGDQLQLFSSSVDEMVIRECIHLAFMELSIHL